MSPGDVTLLLQKADGGDRAAADALYRLVEPDLRAIAGRRKRAFDRSAADGSTTVIVDDAFCKLVGGDVTTWHPGDRAKFFAYVANKVHDLLVEAARARAAQKRGGGRAHVDVHAADPAAARPDESDFLIDLSAALGRFEGFAEPEARAFRLHYFLGCTFDETADLLGVSPTEAKRRCQKAQLWLRRELKGYGHEV